MWRRIALRILLCAAFGGISSAAALPVFSQPATDPAGEFFGIPVSRDNYFFAKRAVMTFSANWRGTPQTEEELEELVWQELLLSYEAFQRDIRAEAWEVDQEIEKLLKDTGVDFNWRVDKEAFAAWAIRTLGMPIDLLRNQMEHLLKLRKLRQQVIDSLTSEVSEEEARQKYLDEYNTLLVELREFDEQEAAEQFYRQVNVPVAAGAEDELIWQDLLLSHAAAGRGITADAGDTEKALVFLIREYEAAVMDGQGNPDPEKLRPWISATFGMEESTLRQFLRKIARIDTLRRKIFSREEPPLSEDELFTAFRRANKKASVAYRLFLDTYASGTEDIVRFDSLAQARAFYRQIKREATAWDEARRREPDAFKRPGFVALDFLLNMWGFQRPAAYEMMEKEIGSLYPPSSIYKGYGVFKILKQRPADPDGFAARRGDYVERVRQIKKHQGFTSWLKTLKEKATIRVFQP